jgi:hypothetical protein
MIKTMGLSENDYKIAEANGIPRNIVYMRFYRHAWDKEKAITQPVRQRLYLWEKWKDKAVVSETTFRNRVHKGWPEEKAATTPGHFGIIKHKRRTKLRIVKDTIAEHEGTDEQLVRKLKFILDI